MSHVIDSLSDEARSRLKRMKVPSSPRPMLATLTDRPFSDDAWIYERKLDGERCLTIKEQSTVRLLSRNAEGLNATYPELVDALESQPTLAVMIDGEVVREEAS